MPLSSNDQQNFRELGKQCKESNFPIFAIVQYLRDCDPALGAIVNSICIKDDGRIDSTEGRLINWARTVIFRIGPVDVMEAEGLIVEGYYTG